MFADTLTISMDGNPFVFTRINQDKYSSEYSFRDANLEMILSIRNTRYTDKTRKCLVDRHNAELLTRYKPDSNGFSKQLKVYAVIENDADHTQPQWDEVAGNFLGNFFTPATVLKLFNRES